MRRVFIGIAAITAAAVLLLPRLDAQSNADHLVVIVRLKNAVLQGAGGLSASEAREPAARDEQRARHDRRLVSELDAALRAMRTRVARAIERRGGRVMYSITTAPALVARIDPKDLDAVRSQDDVESVFLDEPRHAHLDIASQALLVPTVWDAGYTGGAVDVAVIDTGVYARHGAFAPRSSSIITGVFHDAARQMANYWDAPASPDDLAGHGTFVAGVVFSGGDAAHPSHRGMANGIDHLYNIKAGYLTYPSGGSSLLGDLMAGVDWALRQDDPPEVFNYSYGASVTTDDDAYTQFWDAIIDAFDKTVTISAGNSGPGSVGSPGMAYNVLSIANVNDVATATRADDVIASSSSGGPTPGGRKKPDLAAPGTSLLMPSYLGPALWARASGTSFSAPAVAGVAALLIDAGVTDPRAVKALLINSADRLGVGAWDPRFGWGYVNAARAFESRGSVAVMTLYAPGSGRSALLFERPGAEITKATIAWNRHARYEADGWPAPGSLSDVDLRLFSRDNGALRSASESRIDNVEQVTSDRREAVVLAVEATGLLPSSSEIVALAHSGGFVAREGPTIRLVADGAYRVGPNAEFLVGALVGNEGDLRGHGYRVSLALPPGYSLAAGAVAQEVGSLDPGARAFRSWLVRAPGADAAAQLLSVSATTNSYGVESRATASASVAVTSTCSPMPIAVSSLEIPPRGGAVGVPVSAQPGCAWAVSGNAQWLTASPASGLGSGTVTIAAAPNLGEHRSAVVSVAGRPLSLEQAAAPTRRYYLAEGSTRPPFTLEIAITNPNEIAADVRLQFLRADAPPVEQMFTLAALARTTIRVNDVPGLQATDTSTVVESIWGQPLAIERTMSWDGATHGAHGGNAVDAPATTWYFAEGAQGFFDTYLLLANAGDAAANVSVTYLRQGEPPVTRTYEVAARRRATVFAGQDDALVGRAFSMVVRSDAPVIAERAMYWSRGGPFWTGGHESAGVTAPAGSWWLAEGATGPFFDEFVLVGNPNDVAADVDVTWLLPSGETVHSSRTLGALQRLTVDVEREAPELANTAVSATITASQPVVVERSMYWPGTADQWQEAHNAFALDGTAARWVLAEGRVGTRAACETYILLANPSERTALVRVTFLRESGGPVRKTLSVGPTSRFNVVLTADTARSAAPELGDERFGALIEVLDGGGIAVERAMYCDVDGIRWAVGTSAVGTKLP